jgi:hypothetical protein
VYVVVVGSGLRIGVCVCGGGGVGGIKSFTMVGPCAGGSCHYKSSLQGTSSGPVLLACISSHY